MNKKYTIGVDIGGTHTDAVLVDSKENILAAKKVLTTSSLERGFREVLALLMEETQINPLTVESICVGTTHATNAILQGKDLCKVGILRLAGHKPITLPPCYTWPKKLQSQVVVGHVYLNGGYECDGRSITKFNISEVKTAIDALLSQGAESIAITGVFSPLQNEQEVMVAQEIKRVGGDIPISLSSEIGGIGFIERENATVLNASLKNVMKNGLASLEKIVAEFHFICPLHITQNNGSLISLAKAIEYPILTLSAGQTNSFMGAVKLAKLENAIVIDIGGTSTDVGMVKNGIPRQSQDNCHIGGITLNFAMPDVISIGMGGGSHISENKNGFIIGPESCARNLFVEAKAFGGKQLTLTDVALLLGDLHIANANTDLIQIDHVKAHDIINQFTLHLEDLVTCVMTDKNQIPVILVGGGARLVPKKYHDSLFFVPVHADVANAYGAALGEISYKVDEIVSLDNREEMLEGLKQEALKNAILRGACPRLSKICDIQVIPYHYMPGNKARVVVTAKGKRLMELTK